MRFLVLGGSGYLGSKIIHRLLKDGHDVIYTKRASSDLFRLSDVNGKIAAVPADAEAVDILLSYEKVDWILNMACVYPKASKNWAGEGQMEEENSLCSRMIESNIVFPLGILNAAMKYGIKNFMTVGTGLPDNFNMYSFSKKIFSEFGDFYVQKFDINFIDIKLEMFYEADEPDDRFIKNSIRKMMQDEPLDLTEGIQCRDIIKVSDVVDAVMHILHADLHGYNIISVGTGEAPAVREIIEYIQYKLGSASELRFGILPMRKGEPDCCADIRMLEQMGFRCRYGWKQGIDEMIREVKEGI